MSTAFEKRTHRSKSSKLKDDGIFISSGIINIKEDEVRQALLDNNFDIVDTVYMNDWVSFVAKKHV